MAIINKTGITNGGTIESEHITRIIDALSSGSSEIAATGSFTGSFKGPLTGTATSATTAAQVTLEGPSIDPSDRYIVYTPTLSGNATLDNVNTLRFNPITNVLSVTGSINLSGPLTGTASFATTASYALNAIGAGTEYHTLTFFHTPVTNTVDTNETFIGGFPTAPASSSNAIGLVCPFNCTIIRAAATSYVTALRSAAIDVDILIDGSAVDTVGTLNLNSQYDSAIDTYTINVSAGQLITIGLTEAGNTNAVWSTNTTLLLKST